MKILITGAAGFVGCHLISQLKKINENSIENNEIFAFVLNENEFKKIQLPKENIYQVDITDENGVVSAIREIRPDIVYHLAAQSSVGLSWKQQVLTYQVNIIGTAILLEALCEYSPKASIMLIGSAEQYLVTNNDIQPIDESHALQGNNPYSVSKMTQEMLAELYLKKSDLRIIRVRAFNHIGAGQEIKFVIPDWCSQVVEMERNPDKQPVLKVGNIKLERDFTDVRDIVNAYILLSQKGTNGEIYNVGSGCSYSLEDVLNIIISHAKRSGISWEIDEDKLRPADIIELRADNTRLKQATGWEQKYSLEDSIIWIMEEMRKQ